MNIRQQALEAIATLERLPQAFYDRLNEEGTYSCDAIEVFDNMRVALHDVDLEKAHAEEMDKFLKKEVT